MILNNFFTMKHIMEIKDQELTPKLVFDIHRHVTQDALDKPDAAGRFRTAEEEIRVTDAEGVVYHDPPAADELNARSCSGGHSFQSYVASGSVVDAFAWLYHKIGGMNSAIAESTVKGNESEPGGGQVR